MTVYGWQAAGIGALILLGCAAFWGALWGWLELADRLALPPVASFGIPAGVLAAGFLALIATVGVQL